jgi:hypothetical protein
VGSVQASSVQRERLSNRQRPGKRGAAHPAASVARPARGRGRRSERRDCVRPVPPPTGPLRPGRAGRGTWQPSASAAGGRGHAAREGAGYPDGAPGPGRSWRGPKATPVRDVTGADAAGPGRCRCRLGPATGQREGEADSRPPCAQPVRSREGRIPPPVSAGCTAKVPSGAHPSARPTSAAPRSTRAGGGIPKKIRFDATPRGGCRRGKG